MFHATNILGILKTIFVVNQFTLPLFKAGYLKTIGGPLKYTFLAIVYSAYQNQVEERGMEGGKQYLFFKSY